MTDPTTEIASLSRALPDRVSIPGDPRYTAAIATWAKTDVTPAAAITCRGAADVQAAITAARKAKLPLSVRGGGHDWAGRALCEGIVIDLSEMRAVSVASDRRSALLQGGARARDLISTIDPLGLAAVTGSHGGVGMAGLTLGGGYGPLIGSQGLALDNLVEAQVALADGSVVSASATHNQDLFWAIRGGGGNFGVVTQMRCKLHNIPIVLAGVLIYPISEAKSVLTQAATLTASLPDELSAQLGIAAGPDGSLSVLVAPVWCGAPEDGERQLAPFLKLGTLLAGKVERMSQTALLSRFDAMIVDGLRVHIETCSLDALDSCSIDTLLSSMANAVSSGCVILTHEFKGAACRVAADATAFGLRRPHILVEILTMFPDPEDVTITQQHITWARETREAFTAALPGGYPNLLGPDEASRATKSYGDNATRLIQAKRRYDPDNVFSSTIPLPQD
ncbi:FAD-binding oxidoreductase [Bradyrhizobium sp. ARR65]|uniref:FAD-binding oxidoreductase n=1 Tax=Bradyrhizobium sp. ARR65 TaxID=1040989 RepID=UPI000466D8E5|nr:FAD-binding oxidoreductase [Bradyrhizobium sp. ARR65]